MVIAPGPVPSAIAASVWRSDSRSMNGQVGGTHSSSSTWVCHREASIVSRSTSWRTSTSSPAASTTVMILMNSVGWGSRSE